MSMSEQPDKTRMPTAAHLRITLRRLAKLPCVPLVKSTALLAIRQL
jgi:hypothetical protein